jgi:spermidine/putrescine transport system permease protein
VDDHRRILLPSRAGILAGGLLAFTLSIDDFVISFFVAGPGSTTLPIRIYSMIKHGSPPLINALSTLLLVVTFVAVWLSQRLPSGETP